MRDYFCICNTKASFIIQAISLQAAWNKARHLDGYEYDFGLQGLEKVVQVIEVAV